MKAGRPHERHLLRVCGLAAVQALFDRDPARVERLFFGSGMKGEVARFCRILAGERKPFRQVDKAELERVAGTVLHGDVVAVARPRPVTASTPEMARQWARDGKPLLVLDRVGNPHNLGAIVRSAAFFGLDRVLLADHPQQALPSDASYRVAEGGFEHVELFRAPLPSALGQLRPSYHIVGTALGRPPVTDWRPGSRPVALVFGNEEAGLDPATLSNCDEVVAISGSGRMQSLNVAVAAAIMMHLLTLPEWGERSRRPLFDGGRSGG
ncbi:MAG: TrmH family RNA methyltransferase [Stellaceae bacterium]